MASYLLPNLSSKQEIDNVIRSTEELVLVLRFGRESDSVCLQLDHIVRLKPYFHMFSRGCFMFSPITIFGQLYVKLYKSVECFIKHCGNLLIQKIKKCFKGDIFFYFKMFWDICLKYIIL